MTGVARRQRNFFLVEDFFKSLRFHPGTVHHNMRNIFAVEESKARHPEIFPLDEQGSRFIPPLKDQVASGGKT